ncbi:hypothetical protein B0H17DRAFT_1143519 [Mycena rosella]|uniref:Uncharacterized protein n=1 Tax=Mycena rosella TaxID=1033263 RepID=A0AAD7G6L8_MYCRO|nr:hypothetical protein B0H17DRAFT_1143519 [Mycena rosella]
MASSSSTSSSENSGPLLYPISHSVPLVPPPPPPSASSRSTPEGFILPTIPPIPDPLVVIRDSRGHRVLPDVSLMPLPVTDGRVTKLVESHPMVVPKCANCAEMGVDCTFSEAGIPCPPCAVLGIPNCDWTDPFWLMENLRRCRDLYLRDERDELVQSVKDNRLPASLFDREFERAERWFYSGAQGAITRFLLNSYATRDLALHGYRALAASSTDASTLLRFLALGVETHVHPVILQAVGARLQDLFSAMLS